MIKKILLPTDFSELAGHAFEVACQVAKRYNAQLHLLHLVEFPHSIFESISENKGQELPEGLFFLKLAQQKFKKLLTTDIAQGADITEAVQFKNVHEGILKYSSKHNIDQIIMGSHGASGFEEIFIGSNTEKIVRNAEIPVLVIKKRHEDFKIQNCLFATDLENDNIIPLLKAIDFTTLQQINLKLVYVNTPDRFKTSKMIDQMYASFCEKLNRRIEIEVYNDLKVERGIMNYAEHLKTDLIILGAHGRKGLAHFFNGSLSEDLVNHAKRPVMTFKI